ncbi:MAG: hypothetical protein QOC59_1041, partial [Microbacteriaceae bacterium]|nr:hypothetical protein [Microbacteriaceae bacterium]
LLSVLESLRAHTPDRMQAEFEAGQEPS